MSMYYLHRAGETTGPYAPGRLATMIESGEISGDDQVCPHGTEDWIPAHMAVPKEEPLQRGNWTHPDQKPNTIVAKRLLKAPRQIPALVLGLTGFAVLIDWNPLAGVVLILLALFVDRRHYVCGECGNKIEKTSVICPTCRATLVKRLAKRTG